MLLLALIRVNIEMPEIIPEHDRIGNSTYLAPYQIDSYVI
jgi:hypothetical protein